LMGLFEQQPDYFGLDIGSGGIRLVQLKRAGSKPVLLTYGHATVPPGITTSDAPADVAKVAQAVKQLVKDAKVNTKYVVAGVPSSKVFASIITTPKLSQHDLGKAIALQADQYVPMAVKDVKLDWFVIGPGKTPQEQEVLLVAAPNAVTQKYVSLCDQAGLELIALEPNALALTRATVTPGDLAVLVLDIGSMTSDITVVQSNVPKLLRSVNIGGSTFVKAVAQNLGLDEVQADQFTRKFGLTQTKLEGQVFKSIKPSLDLLVGELEKSVKFFSSQYPDIKMEKIVLTGGTTALPELIPYLSTAMGLSVEVANAWTKVGYQAQLQETLMGLSTQYCVAVGLAERDMLT
ncbi:MAG TPA: type IV pilus assembly protein PilM, partial [Candidatus Polarisedimenticolaceae bacterium]|nr:type IV pilus assembly protein PilM [Candidatus Polarisedimenticolaceae bacterium]